VSEQGVELESCQADLVGARAQLADTQAAREALAEKLAVVEAEYRTYKEVRALEAPPTPCHAASAAARPAQGSCRARGQVSNGKSSEELADQLNKLVELEGDRAAQLAKLAAAEEHAEEQRAQIALLRGQVLDLKQKVRPSPPPSLALRKRGGGACAARGE